ncbi:MAG: WecB/TagA/CpsF family glycosyltransferase [Elusimicrobia bacterium]|nr:WecB/TagA/CpsF family glycosyltransferase [Candidatus Liberimonas magnetica]
MDIKDNKFMLFGLTFRNYTLSQAIVLIEELIKERIPRMFFSLSSELVTIANKDANLKAVYENTFLLTIDSYVVYYAAKLLGKPVKEPVSASRVMLDIMPVAEYKKYKIYLLGASEEVVLKTEENLKAKYPNINIVGKHNGYFDLNNTGAIIKDIKDKKPDILFVAMSSPLKEIFISKNLAEMNVPISIGVGGCFDIIAGKCKLAPKWVSKLALEWLYRFIQEPRRLWARYLFTNIRFMALVLKEFLK